MFLKIKDWFNQNVSFVNSVPRIKRIFGLIVAGRFDSLWYALWIRLKRLDLGGASLADLGISSGRSKAHAASGGPYLARVLNSIQIPTGSRVLDLGSGKGGAVFTLSKFPFTEIVGIEISEKLVRIAEANAARLRLQNVHFVCFDAGKFIDIDRFTHIYMFNPFPDDVVKEVMGNLAASFARKPRPFTLIYKSPNSPDNIISSDLFRKEKEFRFPYSHPFYIYFHEVVEES